MDCHTNAHKDSRRIFSNRISIYLFTRVLVCAICKCQQCNTNQQQKTDKFFSSVFYFLRNSGDLVMPNRCQQTEAKQDVLQILLLW